MKLKQKVRINIKNPEGFTSDLFNSIQGEIGWIIEKNSNSFCYKDGWLVMFSEKATEKYAGTHSGMWSGTDKINNMKWWIESSDMEVLK